MTTAITKQPAKSLTLRDRLESPEFAEQLKKSLPKHLPPDRFVRVAITTMMRVPKLAECEQASFFNCMLKLSQYGLEPDGYVAHLIPFRNNKRNVTECQLIIDYKGLIRVVMNTGLVSKLHADKVCEHDIFEFNCGQAKHVIDYKNPRGRPYAYYAMCQMKDGSVKYEVMQLEEINAIRERSKSANTGPWVTDFDEMAKKTVFRRLSKWLPLSSEIINAAYGDDDKPAAGMKDVTHTAPSADLAPSMFSMPKQEEAQQDSDTTDTNVVDEPSQEEAYPARQESAQQPELSAVSSDPLDQLYELARVDGISDLQLDTYFGKYRLSLRKKEDVSKVVAAWKDLLPIMRKL